MNTLRATLHWDFGRWLALLSGNVLAYTALVWAYRAMVASLQGTYTFEHSWFATKLTFAIVLGIVLLLAVGYLTYGLIATRAFANECMAYYRFKYHGGNDQFFRKYRENPSWYYHLAFRSTHPHRSTTVSSRPKQRNIDRPFARVLESC